MSQVRVRHSRLSRNASLGMIILGVITLLFVSGLVGLILIVIGVVMYQFYRRQTRGPLPTAGQPTDKDAST